METIQYRNLLPGDFPAVMAIWQATENIGLSSADNPEALAGFLERNPVLSFVAMAGERQVGAVLCGHDGRRGAIYHLAVASSYRRKGVGKHLVNLCLHSLWEIGIERCHIHVYTQNQAGIDFWQQGGWFLRPELALLSIDVNPNPFQSLSIS